MLVSETFNFGTNPGEYPPGTFIQDSIFKDSTIALMMYQNLPLMTGFIHSSSLSRLDISSIGAFSTGDTLIVQAYKY